MPPLSSPETKSQFDALQVKKTGSGPMVGIVIIVFLLIFGGLYFWGASLNRETETLPLIPGEPAEG